MSSQFAEAPRSADAYNALNHKREKICGLEEIILSRLENLDVKRRFPQIALP
jgi:hypothetical protein